MGDPLGSPRVAPLLLRLFVFFFVSFFLYTRHAPHISIFPIITHVSRGNHKEVVGPTQRLVYVKVRDSDRFRFFYVLPTKNAITFDP